MTETIYMTHEDRGHMVNESVESFKCIIKLNSDDLVAFLWHRCVGPYYARNNIMHTWSIKLDYIEYSAS